MPDINPGSGPGPSSGSDNSGAAAAASPTPSSTPQASGTPTPTPTPAPTANTAMAALQRASAAASRQGGNIATPPADPKITSAAATIAQPGQAGAGTPGQTGAPSGAPSGEPKVLDDAAWNAIPESRRNTITANIRAKVEEQLLGELGWARGIDRNQVHQAVGFAQSINQNPVGFAIQLISELMEVPHFAVALQQYLPGLATNPEEPADPTKWAMPKAKLRAENGMEAYSVAEVQDIVNNLRAEFNHVLQGATSPFQQRFAEQDQRNEVQGIIHQSRQESNQLMGEMRQLPYWPKPGADGVNAGERKIGEYLKAIPVEVRRRIGSIAAVYQAYNTYLARDVYPTLETDIESRVRNRDREKAAAGTGAALPGSGTPPTPPQQAPRNKSELAEHMRKMAGAAAR